MAGTTPRPKEVNGNGPYLIALCRTDAQLDAVIAAGMPEVELDWMELKGLGKAVSRAKAAGLRVALCTNRVQKPGEAGYDRNIARLEPDAVIVRHWGGLMHFAEGTEEFQPVLHGDFSLNVTNSITGRYLLDLGLDTVTASHDLNARQLADLLKRMPVGRLAVTVHHRIPTFHSEHCVYAQNLSDGQNWRNCGRPCDRHQLALRDHLGREHPVIVDVACRNTVFNSTVLSATSRISKLVEGGARRFRLEFVWESQEETRQVLESYADLLR
jgi:putative protease